jgi:putative transposase
VPRKLRVEAAGAIHHVIVRGNAAGRIVLDDNDRRTLVAQLGLAADRSCWRIHAYCVMDTHLHAVVETPEPTLGSGMRRLLGGYAFGFNRRHGRFGHLFSGPFHSAIVETESHVLEVCAHVALNPVRAGLVRAAEDWAWSSHRATAGLIAVPPLLETRLVPAQLHPNPRRAQELYREYVRETGERPRPESG